MENEIRSKQPLSMEEETRKEVSNELISDALFRYRISIWQMKTMLHFVSLHSPAGRSSFILHFVLRLCVRLMPIRPWQWCNDINRYCFNFDWYVCNFIKWTLTVFILPTLAHSVCLSVPIHFADCRCPIGRSLLTGLHNTNNVAFGLLCAIVRSRCYLLGLDGVWIENLHFRFTWKCRRLTPRRRLPAFSVLRLSSHADDSGIALSIRYHTLCLHEHGLGSLNKQHTLNALIAKWTNGTESAWTSDRPKCEAKINK